MYFVINFITLCLTWVFISGQFDLFHLGMGALSCFLVALISTDLIYANRHKGFIARLGEASRFIYYIGWLLYEVVLANFHVLALALSSKRMEDNINPRIFTFKTRLKTDFAKFVLASSITLTPGTVTIRILGDTFYVHAISPKAQADLADTDQMSEIERRVTWVFEGGCK